MTTLEIQRRLQALGFYQGNLDGAIGPVTLQAISSALDRISVKPMPAKADPGTVPAEWMPPANMARVILHWTAGAHEATEFDREHYHILINGDGRVVKGIPSIAANAPGGSGRRASHTLNCNTGSIGVSMCCMVGAIERPFNPGAAPLTQAQWDKAADVIADLCRRYGIHVDPRTVLSHAEVQANLGIKQRGKWDISVLPFDRKFDTARECGDRMRREVQERLEQT